MRPNLQHIILASLLGGAACSAAETPAAALLVLNKGDNTLAIVDPMAATVVARVPSGPDPTEANEEASDNLTKARAAKRIDELQKKTGRGKSK